ncbi:MAG: hypothetical protein IT385_01735 [Deltaproteobacteria bacterium]|nr:hypothetical protein [Deltaproteobacteria bacterium]
MRTSALVSSTALVVALATSTRAQEPRTDPGLEPLGHKHLVDAHAALPRDALGGLDAPAWDAVAAFRAPTFPIVKRTVLGYLPYWSYTSGNPYVPARWDLLTILAWFAAEMDGSGNITNKHGWGGATTAAIVQDAHAHGVEVIVTITNFNSTQIASIVGSAANRQRAIDSCLGLMEEHGADGINIDFEFVPASAKANFVTFMSELKDAVVAAQPNGKDGHVSLAGPAVDWSGAYDYDQLLIHTDGIMIMAYGYHWSGGDPGPIATLFSGNLWGTHSIEWTIADYFEYGGIENRGHVILGLPWYGNAWRVANRDVPGDALANGTTVTYKAAMPQFASNGREWEPVSKSSYYHRTVDGNLQQVWVDDGEAFQARVAYADQMDIGGIGIWALGYEGTHPDLWDAIHDELAVTAEPSVEPGPEVVEVAPEPSAEPALEPPPEPGPEPVAEPVADASTTVPPVEPDASGGPGATALDPLRRVQADVVEDAGGCAGGPVSGLWLALAAIVWGVRRRER